MDLAMEERKKKVNDDCIAHLKLELQTDDKQYFNYCKSSILQGVLMQQIDPEYATKLHEQGLKPYSQYVREENGHVIWHVMTLNGEATRQIMQALLDISFSEFYIEHDDQKVIIAKKEYSTRNTKELFDEFYEMKAERYIQLEFLTPTAFKKNGRYFFFPELFNIFYSCMTKMDSASVENSMFSEETLEQLVNESEIVSYSLRSVKFPLEGTKIPAFIGKITIAIHGNQTISSFGKLLLSYAEYSGIGIKTAMGMGAVRIISKGDS